LGNYTLSSEFKAPEHAVLIHDNDILFGELKSVFSKRWAALNKERGLKEFFESHRNQIKENLLNA